MTRVQNMLNSVALLGEEDNGLSFVSLTTGAKSALEGPWGSPLCCIYLLCVCVRACPCVCVCVKATLLLVSVLSSLPHSVT